MRNFLNKLKNSGLVLIDQGVVSGTSFFTGIVLSRLLCLDAYGRYVLLWMFVLFALSVAQALITKPLLSFYPKMEAETAQPYLGATHTLQCLLSVLAAVITVLILAACVKLQILEPFGWRTMLGLSLSVAFMMNYDYYRKCFFLQNDLKTPLFIDTQLAITQLGGIGFLFYFDLLNIPNVLLLLALNYLLICLVSATKMVAPVFNRAVLGEAWRKHFDFSKWLLGTVLAQWLCGNLFIIWAGGILGAGVVGALRIAQNVIGLTHVIFLAMENVVPINAARVFKDGGQKKLYEFLKNISLKIGWLVMGILILVALFSPNILSWLYGAVYMEYAYILIGFCIIYLLVYIGYPLRFALRTLEMTRPIFMAYVLGAVFSLLCAKPMLMYWGIYGLLAGLFITQFITQLVYIISLWKIKKYYENHSLGTR